jgi:hypothetical protein
MKAEIAVKEAALAPLLALRESGFILLGTVDQAETWSALVKPLKDGIANLTKSLAHLNAHLAGVAERDPMQVLAEPFHSMILKVWGKEPITILDAYTGHIDFASGGQEYGLRIWESTPKTIRYILFKMVDYAPPLTGSHGEEVKSGRYIVPMAHRK